MIADATPLAPRTAASFAGTPRDRSLYMFSMTTMELSTSMPTPSARPDNEMMFRVTPEKYIITTANRILMGMEHAMITVGFRSFRKKSRTKMASKPPISIFCRTESTTISI